MSSQSKDKKVHLPVVIHTDIFSKIYNFYLDKKINDYAVAASMYTFLYKTTRHQNNIRVHATNSFIQKGAGISSHKIGRVKRDLTEMELIESIRPREANGQYAVKSYIEVKYVWKKETLKKLFYEESKETLKYKIAKKLLMNRYDDFEEIQTPYEFGTEFELNIKGKKMLVFDSCYYFEDNLLKCISCVPNGDEFVYTVPKDRVLEIILDLASKEKYSFESINEMLQTAS